MKNPYSILKPNRSVDPDQLEKAVNKLYQAADDSKVQKAFSSMQDRTTFGGIPSPEKLIVVSEEEGEDTLLKTVQVDAAWQPTPKAARYIAELKSVSNTASRIREIISPHASWESVTAGATIKIRVKAVDDYGNEGHFCQWVNHTTVGGNRDSAPPTGLDVSKLGKWVHASCDKIKAKSHASFEWHESADDDFTPDTLEERSNLVGNGSFEGYDSSDEVTGWTIQSSLGSVTSFDTFSHSGDRCLKLDVDSANNYLYQEFTLDYSSYYIIEGFARSASGYVANVEMDLNFSSGGVVSGYDTSKVKRIGPIWKRFAWKILTNTTATQTMQLRLRFDGTNTGEAYFDDIRIRKVSGTYIRTTKANHCFFRTDTTDPTYVRVKSIDVNGNASAFSEVTGSDTAFSLSGLGEPTTAPTIDSGAFTTGKNGFKWMRKGWCRVTWTNPTTMADSGEAVVEADIVGYKVYYITATDYASYESDYSYWGHTFFHANAVNYSSPGAVVRGLTLGEDYRFRVSTLTALVGQNSESDLSGASDEQEIVESDAPDEDNITILEADQDGFYGVDTTDLFAKAHQAIGFKESEVDSEGVGLIHIKYKLNAGLGFYFHQWALVNNMDVKTDDQLTNNSGSVNYYVLYLDNLHPGKLYDYEVRYWSYGLVPSDDWADAAQFTACDATVAGWGDVSNFQTYIYPIERGWWKKTQYRLNIEFDVVDNNDAAARKWQFAIARLKPDDDGHDKTDFKLHTVSHFDNLDVGGSGDDHVELNIPIPYMPSVEFTSVADTYSGFKVNCRAWLNGKPGTPFFSTTADWRQPQDEAYGGWTDGSGDGTDGAKVPFGVPDDWEDDITVIDAPDVEPHWWRYWAFSPPDGFDYPANFAYMTLHATYKDVDLTSTDGLNAADARTAQRKSRVMTIFKTHARDMIFFLPYKLLDADGDKARVWPKDFDDVEFRLLIHVWVPGSAFGVEAGAETPKASASTITGSVDDADDPWKQNYIGDENLILIASGDHLYVPASALRWGRLTGATKMYVELTSRFSAGDILYLVPKGALMGDPANPGQELVHVTAIDSDIKGDYLEVTRGYGGSTPEIMKAGDILAKTAVFGDTYRYIWVDADNDNPAIKILEVTEDEGGNLTSEAVATFAVGHGNEDPDEPYEPGNPGTGYNSAVDLIAPKIWLPDGDIGPWDTDGNAQGVKISKGGVLGYDKDGTLGFQLKSWDGTLVLTGGIVDPDGNDYYHQIETDALYPEAVLKVTGDGDAIHLGEGASTIIIGNSAAGAVITLDGEDATIECAGEINLNSGGNMDIKTGGSLTVSTDGGIKVTSVGTIDVEASGGINVEADGAINVETDGAIQIGSGGNLTCTSANIRMHTGGHFKIGEDSSHYVFDFDIEDRRLTIGEGTEGISITGDTGDQSRIESLNFASGLLGKGFRWSANGHVEATDMTLRGALKSSSFVYDEVACVGGRVFVAPSAPLAEDMTAAQEHIVVGFDAGFAADDYLQIKDGLNYEIMQVDQVGSWYIDSSSDLKMVTTGGVAPTQDTSDFMFGRSSASFGGSGYFTTIDHADWVLGTTWTVCCWMKPTTSVASGYPIYEQLDGTHLWTVEFIGGVVYFTYQNGGAKTTITGPSVSADVWQFVAVVCDGGTVGVSVNGVWGTTATGMDVGDIGNGPLYIGSNYTGKLDDVMINKGTALWTPGVDFEPPADGLLSLGSTTVFHQAFEDGVYAVTREVDSTTGRAWTKGTAVVSFGYAATDGFIIIDSESANTPYIDIINRTATTNWDDWETKVRLGNLSGIGDGDFDSFTNKYGLYSDNAYLKGELVISSAEGLTVKSGGSIQLDDGGDLILTPHDSSPSFIYFGTIAKLSCSTTNSVVGLFPDTDSTGTLSLGSFESKYWSKIFAAADEYVWLSTFYNGSASSDANYLFMDDDDTNLISTGGDMLIQCADGDLTIDADLDLNLWSDVDVNIAGAAEINLSCSSLTINGAGNVGANFSGAVSNITVVDGIVTAAS